MRHLIFCRAPVYNQVEKSLTAKLTSLEQQHSKTQEVLKEKENSVQKLQAQLKATQGSFEQDRKKLQGQVAELKEVGVKKASST